MAIKELPLNGRNFATLTRLDAQGRIVRDQLPNNVGNRTVGRISTTVVDNRSMQFALKVNF
jgi:hypothetical protein